METRKQFKMISSLYLQDPYNYLVSVQVEYSHFQTCKVSKIFTVMFSFLGSWQRTHLTKWEIKPRMRTLWDLKTQDRGEKNPWDDGWGASWAAGPQPSRLCQKSRREILQEIKMAVYWAHQDRLDIGKVHKQGVFWTKNLLRNKADRKSCSHGAGKDKELAHTISARTLLSDTGTENSYN